MNERPADTIYVGNAPVMNYVADALHILNSGGRLVLKARGNAIRYAVDVEQILRQRYFRGAAMSSADVTLSTEQVPNERRSTNDDRDTINLSAIEIVVSSLLPTQRVAQPVPIPPPAPTPKTLVVPPTSPPVAFVPHNKQPAQTVNPPKRRTPRGEGQGQ